MGAKPANSRPGGGCGATIFDLPWGGLGHKLSTNAESRALYRAGLLKYWRAPAFLELLSSLAQTATRDWRNYA